MIESLHMRADLLSRKESAIPTIEYGRVSSQENSDPEGPVRASGSVPCKHEKAGSTRVNPNEA